MQHKFDILVSKFIRKIKISAFRDATKEPYTNLFLDLRSNSLDALRVRANVQNNFLNSLPAEKTINRGDIHFDEISSYELASCRNE